jgi:hypothetical protein
MKLIDRPLYINRLKRINGSPDIKIITGIRRCGKSRLLQAFVKYIQSTENDANIIFIDYARLENESLREYHALHQYVLEHHQQGKSNYLMIDEVQMCPNFETAINSLHSSEQFDIYLTGSNAFLLSADLATLFTGRHIEIPVLPFSFKEYCVYHNVPSNDIQTMFDKYVTEGGLSGSYVYTDASDKENYIKEVYSTILTRDLTEKYNLTDAHALIQVANYLMDNIGNITSPNNVSGGLTANSTSTSHVTVRRYIQYLCNAFVFYKVDRYDIRGRKYLESLNKYYLSDTGIRFAMLGKRNMDWGRVYENIVFLELKRRGYEVYVGKLYQKEVDFVIVRGNEKAYVQVSDNIAENTTFEREVSPLLSIKDAYPKLLIARTRHEEYDYQGIKIFDIAHWLTEDYT